MSLAQAQRSLLRRLVPSCRVEIDKDREIPIVSQRRSFPPVLDPYNLSLAPQALLSVTFFFRSRDPTSAVTDVQIFTRNVYHLSRTDLAAALLVFFRPFVTARGHDFLKLGSSSYSLLLAASSHSTLKRLDAWIGV